MNTDTLPQAGRREWIGLAILMLPTLLIAMDLTVLHLAVPSLTEDLKPSSSQLLWITDIYGFMIAGLLVTMGTLGDRIGRRKLLMIGGVGFALASVGAAVSTSAEMLIASRAILGVAGATLMPSTMSLIRNMFLDPRQRTVAIGVWVSGFSAGSAIGPLVGGALLESFAWGSVFLLAVPVMLVLLIAGLLFLPEYKDPNPGQFDLMSAALSLVSVLAVIYGLKQIAEDGVALLPILCIAAGIATAVIFIRRQKVLPDPLIDLNLFRVPAFSASLATYTFGILLAFGPSFFMAQYLQLVLGLSPLRAGLWSVPGAVAFIVASNLSPRLVRRVRPAYIVAGGLSLTAFGIGLFTQVGLDSLPIIVVGNTMMSLGFGFAFSLMVDLVVSNAPPERAGAASAIAETGAEFGGALGIALLGSIGMAVYRREMDASLPAGISPEIAATAKETLGGAVAAAGDLSEPLSTALLNVAHEAFVQGLHIIAIIGMVGFASLAILNLILLRDIRPHDESETVEAPSEGAPTVLRTTPLPRTDATTGD